MCQSLFSHPTRNCLGVYCSAMLGRMERKSGSKVEYEVVKKMGLIRSKIRSELRGKIKPWGNNKQYCYNYPEEVSFTFVMDITKPMIQQKNTIYNRTRNRTHNGTHNRTHNGTHDNFHNGTHNWIHRTNHNTTSPVYCRNLLTRNHGWHRKSETQYKQITTCQKRNTINAQKYKNN